MEWMEFECYLEVHGFDSWRIAGWMEADPALRDLAIVRREDISRLINSLAHDDPHLLALQSLLEPCSVLNPCGVLLEDLWRFGNFDCSLQWALRLRTGPWGDVLFDSKDEPYGIVYPQPKFPEGNFPGMSLYTTAAMAVDGLAVLAVYDYASVQADPKHYEELFRAWGQGTAEGGGGKKGRPITWFKLPANTELPSEEWLVDHDNVQRGHVSLSVNMDTVAKDIPDESCMAFIPAMTQWPWEAAFVVITAMRAEAPADFLPDEPALQ